MTRTLVNLIAILLLVPVAARAKNDPKTITAADAFVNIQLPALDLLDGDMREQLANNYLMLEEDGDLIGDLEGMMEEVGDTIPAAEPETAVIINMFGGLSELRLMTDNFVDVQISAVSTLQIKVLPLKDGGSVVMTIYTTGKPGETQDSEIAFYDAALRPLQTSKFFKAPRLADFFDTKGYKTNMKEIQQMLPFYTVVYTASPDNDGLTARLTYSDRLTVEDQKLIELLIKPNITYNWKKGKYE